MNLSCGNCKKIQPFLGDPPKCDVCGWVCGDKSTDNAHSQNLRAQQQSAREQTLQQRPAKRTSLRDLGHEAAKGVAKAVRTLMKFVAFWLVVAAIGYVLYLILASDQTKLSNEYGVPEDHVFVQPKPHGCNFDDAPLGNKHCHFEKVVDVERTCPGPDCPVAAVYESWRKVDA